MTKERINRDEDSNQDSQETTNPNSSQEIINSSLASKLSQDIIAEAEKLLDRENNWINNELYKVNETLNNPTQLRKQWLDYKNLLLSNKVRLEALKIELQSWIDQWSEVNDLAKQPEVYKDLQEEIQQEFTQIKNNVERIFEDVIAILRPTEPFQDNCSEALLASPDNINLKDKRSLRVKSTSQYNRLIQNPRFGEAWLLYSVAEKVDEVQIIVNDLYRTEAKYGDGSTAFMAMKEQFEAGVGKLPKSLAGDTLHETKCREYSIGLRNLIMELNEQVRQNFPAYALERIEEEIRKMEEAVQWTEDYRNGLNPKIPNWAKPWKEQLGK